MHLKTLVMMGAAGTCIAGVAQAGDVQIRDALGGETSTGDPGGFFLSGTGDSIRSTVNGGPTMTLTTGTFDFEADFGDGNGFQAFLSYCIQPDVNIAFDPQPLDPTGLNYTLGTLEGSGFTTGEVDFLSILWSNAFALSTTSQLRAAAFQAIVWELSQENYVDPFTELSTSLTDGVGSLRSGNFDMNFTGFSQSVILQANSWIGNIQNAEWTTSVELVALNAPNSQDLIAVIPAPSTAALAFLGAPALLRRRRH